MATRTRTMMTSKIHRATVTRADLDYVGSITVDTDPCLRRRTCFPVTAWTSWTAPTAVG